MSAIKAASAAFKLVSRDALKIQRQIKLHARRRVANIEGSLQTFYSSRAEADARAADLQTAVDAFEQSCP